MAFTFAHGDHEDAIGNWTVAARGTIVGDRRTPLCDVVQTIVHGEEGAEDFVEEHRSAQLLASDLVRQDIVITASRAERSAVAQLDPRLRSQCFTLREALWLGSAPASPVEHEMSSATANGEEKSDLERYAALLHSRRGMLPPPPRRLRMTPWAPAADPFDITDAHHLRAAQHKAVLSAMRDDVVVLRTHIARFLAD